MSYITRFLKFLLSLVWFKKSPTLADALKGINWKHEQARMNQELLLRDEQQAQSCEAPSAWELARIAETKKKLKQLEIQQAIQRAVDHRPVEPSEFVHDKYAFCENALGDVTIELKPGLPGLEDMRLRETTDRGKTGYMIDPAGMPALSAGKDCSEFPQYLRKLYDEAMDTPEGRLVGRQQKAAEKYADELGRPLAEVMPHNVRCIDPTIINHAQSHPEAEPLKEQADKR